MATVKVTVPDSEVEKAAASEIKRLKRVVKQREQTIDELEKRLGELERNLGAAKRVQNAFKDFASVVAEELDLDYDRWA